MPAAIRPARPAMPRQRLLARRCGAYRTLAQRGEVSLAQLTRDIERGFNHFTAHRALGPKPRARRAATA
jgi:hypothetical protein